MSTKLVKYALYFCLLISLVPAVYAETMTYIYNAPESDKDKRYSYQWEILRSALEMTRSKYGEYRMVKSEVMSERRQVRELENVSGKLSVMYLDSKKELEEKLIPVRIPVDKGLVGYRVLLIRKEEQARISQFKTLDDLKTLKLGQGLGWIDVGILRSNGFKVVTGSFYDGLFGMLQHKRFDVFPRGAVEIVGEYNTWHKMYPDLSIEKNILLYYPLPMYFWFAKSQNGKVLADRVEAGMNMMIKDGTYDRIFNKHFSKIIRQLRLNKRKLFKIDNPFLVPETPFKDKRLWFKLDY